MKTTKTIILFLALGAALFTSSCKKESKEEAAPTPVAPTPGTFNAKVNGTSASFANNFYFTQGSGGSTAIGISGSNGSNGISLLFYDFDSNIGGTYTIDGMMATAYYQVGSSSYAATSGTITITSYANNKISGTFSFSGGGYNITQGTFTNVLKK